MKTFEYRCVGFTPDRAGEAYLNAEGKKGWELVSVVPPAATKEICVAVMMRETTENAAK